MIALPMFGVNLRIPSSPDLDELLKIVNQDMVYFYCNDIIDEYILKGPLDEHKLKQLAEHSHFQHAEIINADGMICYLIIKCEENSTDHLIRIKSALFSNQFFLVSYIQQIRKWQYYTTITFAEENIEVLMEKIDPEFNVTITHSQSLPGLNISGIEPYIELKTLFNDLTSTQYEVIQQAIEAGYYKIPREVTLPELATRRNISRSGLEKSFRIAENKLIRTVVHSLYQYNKRILAKEPAS